MKNKKKILKISLGILFITIASFLVYTFSNIVFARISLSDYSTDAYLCAECCYEIQGHQTDNIIGYYRYDFMMTCPAKSGWTQTSSSPVIWRDDITGLYWTAPLQTSINWQNSINECATLDHGGRTDWRLPTRDELMQVAPFETDGTSWNPACDNCYSGNDMYANTGSSFTGVDHYFWSINTYNDNTSQAWQVLVELGFTYFETKTAASSYEAVRCVARDARDIWGCGMNIMDSRDGKIYATVQIGDQCWMAENLNVGTSVSGSSTQGTSCSSIQKYCYNDSESNCDIYGGLYQWNQMMCGSTTEGIQGICPDGWHIPTDSEWMELEDYLGMSSGDQTSTGWRTSGSVHIKLGTWTSGGGINSSGFASQPGGYRHPGPGFSEINGRASIWSSTPSTSNNAWNRDLSSSTAGVYRAAGSDNRNFGVSVRCIKD